MISLEELSLLFASLISTYGLLGLVIVTFISNASIVFPIPYVFFVFGMGTLTTPVLPFIDPVWNPLFIGVAAGIGCAAGEMTAYLAGLGVDSHFRISKKDHPLSFTLKKLLDKYGILIVITFASIPTPFDVLGFTSGVFRYDWKKFFIGTFIGRTVMNTSIAFAGKYSAYSIIHFFEDPLAHLPTIVILLIVIIGIALIARLVWKKVEEYGN